MTEVSIDFKFPPIAKYAKRISRYLPMFIAAKMQAQRGRIFDSEGSYNGRPGWKPLKHRKGQILKLTGTLSKSLSPSTGGNKPGFATGSILKYANGIVTIGTNIKYAAVHDQGAVIQPHEVVVNRSEKTGKFKKITKTTQLVEVYMTKTYEIPARPFSDFTREDVAELKEQIESYMTYLMGGGT